MTALMLAVEVGRLDIVQYLVSNGAKVNMTDQVTSDIYAAIALYNYIIFG
jgi:ankyrin repeat protein